MEEYPFTAEKLAPGMFAQGRIAYDTIIPSLLPEARFASGHGGRIVLPQPAPGDRGWSSGCIAACILDGEGKLARNYAKSFLADHDAIGGGSGLERLTVSRGDFDCQCQPRTGVCFGQQSVVVDLPDLPDAIVIKLAAKLAGLKLPFATPARPRPRAVLVGLAASREALLVDCEGRTGE